MKTGAPTLRTFRCPEYAAHLTPLSCASRHVAASRTYRAGTESPWHLTACKECRIGEAHAADQTANRVSNVRGVAYAERALTTPELVQLRTKRPRARAEQRHGFTFRAEEAAVDAPPDGARTAFAPIAAGAPAPDLEAQQRDAARAADRERERRRAYERARRAKERARKEREESALNWTRVAEHVETWLAENPKLTRRDLHARAVAELGVTVSYGRFAVQIANRLEKARDITTRASDDAVIEHMRAHVVADSRRGWRWHAASLRGAGMVVSADRVRRALKALRGEVAGTVVGEKGRAA
ncbi:MAG: hypothetical protein MUE69_33335 [Myxococcota bacterium]|jgi:hypothetical protein|nr:hypothetical protein [Myxococcota bacterium]